MFKFASDFWGSKTTWTTVGGIATAVGAGISHQMPWSTVGIAVFGALLTLFHRDTVQKGNEQGAKERAQLRDIASAAKPVAADLESVLALFAASHHHTGDV